MNTNTAHGKPIDYPTAMEQILRSKLSDIEKLAQAFDWVTARILEASDAEIELLRAMQDREALIKEQIKNSSTKHARQIFTDCYLQLTGRRPWNE